MLILQQSLKKASFDLKAVTSSQNPCEYGLIIPQYTETVNQFQDSAGISFYPVRQNQLSSTLTINQPLPTDGFCILLPEFKVLLITMLMTGMHRFLPVSDCNSLLQLSLVIISYSWGINRQNLHMTFR